MINIVNPLRPLYHGWNQDYNIHPALLARGYPIQRWVHERDISVLSAVEVAKDENKGPEYHISISMFSFNNCRFTPARIDTVSAKWVLHQFGLDGAEEDNHVPHGIVRNFWRPVANTLVGLECKCKADEVEIREMKGDFVWRP